LRSWLRWHLGNGLRLRLRSGVSGRGIRFGHASLRLNAVAAIPVGVCVRSVGRSIREVKLRGSVTDAAAVAVAIGVAGRSGRFGCAAVGLLLEGGSSDGCGRRRSERGLRLLLLLQRLRRLNGRCELRLHRLMLLQRLVWLLLGQLRLLLRLLLLLSIDIALELRRLQRRVGIRLRGIGAVVECRRSRRLPRRRRLRVGRLIRGRRLQLRGGGLHLCLLHLLLLLLLCRLRRLPRGLGR